MRGWRALLRLAWRDVRRARGRSALVLTLIALPVLAVTIAVTVLATEDVSGTDGLDRRLGAADAKVTVEAGIGRVLQQADPDVNYSAESDPAAQPLTAAEVSELLGGDVRLVELSRSEARILTDEGVAVAELTQVDLADAASEGLVRLAEGRLPREPGEVLVNTALADLGPGLGETLRIAGGDAARVVGVGEDASSRSFPVLFAPPGWQRLEVGATRTWLADTKGPVTWSQVRVLNEHGATVLSRAVMLDPPADSELPRQVRRMDPGEGSAAIAVLALVITMVLLEVVLLAGPAFAVTVRRQSRTLALMAATGATPGQARQAVLAIAVVLGVWAAVLGVGLGVLVAWTVAVPVAQSFSTFWFGPFDVPWLPVLVVAGFGVLSAVLAAIVPAWLASRLDVVAVLSGRRGDAKPSVRSPVIGVVLVALGVAGAVAGALRGPGGEFWIAFSALLSVFGMILLVPVVLGVLSRLGARWPLTARYAVRDAARHRSRTVPAISAVAATVAGVVAFGIATSSDAAEARATYQPQFGSGTGIVTAIEATSEEWLALDGVVRRLSPEASVTTVRGTPEGDGVWYDVSYAPPQGRTNGHQLLEWAGGSLGTMNLVAERVPDTFPDLSEQGRRDANGALAAGQVVVFSAAEVDADTVRIRANRWNETAGAEERVIGPVTVPARYVVVEGSGAPVKAILPPAVAEGIGMPSVTTALLVHGTDLSEQTEADLQQAVAAETTYGSVYVERGYQPSASDRLVLWVLGGLGAVLMLGGTLTATFLALTDARPDLATLAAVGATPRTRRSVAASSALVVGGIGAVLGALVGLVPGIAVTYPLTTVSGVWSGEGPGAMSFDGQPPQTGPFLEIPWLMVAVIVVGLPLVTAALIGILTRSRLPMVSRLE